MCHGRGKSACEFVRTLRYVHRARDAHGEMLYIMYCVNEMCVCVLYALLYVSVRRMHTGESSPNKPEAGFCAGGFMF